jgi:hypothetical protein
MNQCRINLFQARVQKRKNSQGLANLLRVRIRALAGPLKLIKNRGFSPGFFRHFSNPAYRFG